MSLVTGVRNGTLIPSLYDGYKTIFYYKQAATTGGINKEKRMASPNANLYVYAVFKSELRDSINGNITDQAVLLVPPTPVLAYTEDQARAVASRAIPENETEDMSRIVVLVRPF
jgi:hypothetical protein